AFFPHPGGNSSRVTSLTLLVVSAMLATGMAISYYGNESINYIGHDELATIDQLYQLAPSGSLVISQTSDPPVLHRLYEQLAYDHLLALLEEDAIAEDDRQLIWLARLNDLEALAERLRRSEQQEVCLLVARSQTAHVRLFGSLPSID